MENVFIIFGPIFHRRTGPDILTGLKALDFDKHIMFVERLCSNNKYSTCPTIHL